MNHKSMQTLLVLAILLSLPLQTLQATPEQDRIDTVAKSVMALHHIPNLEVGIIANQQLIWSKGYSLQAYTDDTPNIHSIFEAGSISKTITAIAIIQLHEQGIVDLDEDISTYLPFALRSPNYPNTPITLRNILSHSSGLTNQQWRQFLYFSILNYPNALLNEYLLPEGIIYDDDVWGDWKPSEGSFYSSIGMEIAEYVVELTTNTSFADYCKTHIFQPLEMYNTSFKLNDLPAEQMMPTYFHFPFFYLALPAYENHNYAAGGMRTSLSDLSHILICMQNNGTYNHTQILSAHSIQQMKTIQYPQSVKPKGQLVVDNREFGLGWLIYPENQSTLGYFYQGHSGTVPGGVSGMYLTDDVGIIYFGNQWTFANPINHRLRMMLVNTLFEEAQSLTS